MKHFYVYILKCNDGSYYTGHTDDIDKRIAEHHSSENTGYTADKKPFELVYTQEFMARDEAIAAECQIKKWSRKKKEALIAENWSQLKQLAKKQNWQ